MWDMRAAAPSMRALLWVWRSSAYCYASMELPMIRLWGHTKRSPSDPMCYIKSSDITKALNSASRIHGAEFGIGPDDVNAGCLRSTGTMALFCGDVDSSCIRLLGRWQSWTMLRYLHLQSRAAMCGLSASMLQGGKIDMLPPGSLPSIFREPPAVLACITPKYSEVYETL